MQAATLYGILYGIRAASLGMRIRDLVVVSPPTEAVGDGDSAAVVCGAAQPLGGVGDERLPLVSQRAAVGVEEGEALHLVGAGIADGLGGR